MFRERVKLPFRKLEHAEGIKEPCYMTEGSAGMDLHAAVADETSIMPGEVCLIPTGIAVAVPAGYELQIRPRSGLAAKEGIGILNSPGTIDSDYRGEIKIILINLGQKPFVVRRNERVAQMVLCPVMQALLEARDELPPTERNGGGFGHTG